MADAPRPRPLHLLTPVERPPFNDQIIATVRSTVATLKRMTATHPRGTALMTDTFYEQLFIIAPDARGMFQPDLTPQSDRLLRALLDAADGLENPDQVERKLRIWGVIHRRAHDVDDSHYVYVGQALVRTIKILLPDAPTVTHSSWVAVYAWLAAVMIDGADEAQVLRDNPAAASTRPEPVAYFDATTRPPIGTSRLRSSSSRRRVTG